MENSKAPKISMFLEKVIENKRLVSEAIKTGDFSKVQHIKFVHPVSLPLTNDGDGVNQDKKPQDENNKDPYNSVDIPS